MKSSELKQGEARVNMMDKPATTRREKVGIMKELFLAYLAAKGGGFGDIWLSKKGILTLSLAMTHLWAKEHGLRDFEVFDLVKAFDGRDDETE